MIKPRTLWVFDQPNGKNISNTVDTYTAVEDQPQNPDWTEFIEKSAYDELQAKHDNLLESWDAMLEGNRLLQAEVERLTARLSEFKKYARELEEAGQKLRTENARLKESRAKMMANKRIEREAAYNSFRIMSDERDQLKAEIERLRAKIKETK